LRARTSLDDLEDDFAVHYNDLYCAAAAASVYKREMIGDDVNAAYPAVFGFIRDKAPFALAQGVFHPEDSRTCAQALAWLEHEYGRDELLRRIGRSARRVPAAAIAEVYSALAEVVGLAAERGLGFVATVHDDQAETRLAERRREREETFRRARNRPAQTTADGARIQRELEAMVWRAYRRHGPPDELARLNSFAVVVPAALIPELSRLMAEARAIQLAEDVHGHYACIHRAIARADEESDHVQSCSEYDELAALWGLRHALGRDCPGALRSDWVALLDQDASAPRTSEDGHRSRSGAKQADQVGLYAPEQTRELSRAVASWQDEQGGRDAAIDTLHAGFPRAERPGLAAAYGRFVALLATADELDHGFLWVMMTEL
ncbi:MAG: hypothetical protein AAGC55_12940, partial [Myxococcota bacterium]